MKLTDGERLIAVMLAEVMEALKLDKQVDPKLVKGLICSGDDWAVKRKYPGIFGVDTHSPTEVSETTNILWMWGILESAIGRLEGTEAEEANGWHWKTFVGFDGNHDPHYGIALTMINELGEFETLKGRALNSHSQGSLPRYRSMYAKFERYLKETSGDPLSFDMLRDLCA